MTVSRTRASETSVENDSRRRRTPWLASAVAVVAAVAGIGAGPAGAGAPPAPLRAETIAMTCQAEWDASTGATRVFLFAPDTPAYPHPGISGLLPFTSGTGTGIFTPYGLMLVVCAYRGGTHPSDATWKGDAAVTLFRGGTDFSFVGTRRYGGRAHVLTRGDWTVITVVGKYVTTCSDPVCT